MELSTITSFFASPSDWGLIFLIALVVERLIKGGYLRFMVGKKTRQHDCEDVQDGRNTVAVDTSEELLARMSRLELYFNHETSSQYDTLIRGQVETLDILRRIERDGIRIKT